MLDPKSVESFMSMMRGETIPADVVARVQSINERLVIARKNAGLTQGQVAEKLRVVASTISHYESGLRGVDLPTLLMLCDLYDVSVAWVMTGSNPNFDPSAFYESVKTLRDDLNADLRKIAALLETVEQPVLKED